MCTSSLVLIYKNKKMKPNGLAAQEIMNLKIAFLMKVDRSHEKFRTKKK